MRFSAASLIVLLSFVFSPSGMAGEKIKTAFKRVPTQFIAALGDPNASSGAGAETWGFWETDPGPRGVWLSDYDKLQSNEGIAPANWRFDKTDWWVDENGLLMENPVFSVQPGQYVVTGDREAVAVLTVHAKDQNGESRWELSHDVKLYDVTHLPCRSARYTPVEGENACSPANVELANWPIEPGGIMPDVQGCQRLDYSVLFIIGVEVKI